MIPFQHPSGTYYIAPADDRQNEYAAGFDNNAFPTRDEAEAAIPWLVDAIGGEWTVEVRS